MKNYALGKLAGRGSANTRARKAALVCESTHHAATKLGAKSCNMQFCCYTPAQLPNPGNIDKNSNNMHESKVNS